MKHTKTANIISAARIPLSLSLLLMPPDSAAFHTVYALCGISDIADGYIARKTGTESEFGSRLDSVADAVFVLSCFIKLLPKCSFKPYIWAWISLIAAAKLTALFIVCACEKKLVMPHTVLNKITGLLLFAFGIICFKINMNAAVIPVCTAASFAAIEELTSLKNHA